MPQIVFRSVAAQDPSRPFANDATELTCIAPSHQSYRPEADDCQCSAMPDRT